MVSFSELEDYIKKRVNSEKARRPKLGIDQTPQTRNLAQSEGEFFFLVPPEVRGRVVPPLPPDGAIAERKGPGEENRAVKDFSPPAIGDMVIFRAPRFIDRRDGTVVDTETGLQWAKRDNGADVTWQEARDYCAALSLGGRSDWGLPTLDQLEGLYDSASSELYKVLLIFAEYSDGFKRVRLVSRRIGRGLGDDAYGAGRSGPGS